MLSIGLGNYHANGFIDALEEEEARFTNTRQEYKTRINAIAAKKEDLTMQRGVEAIKYAVSNLPRLFPNYN